MFLPTGRNDSGEENVPLDLSRGGFSPVSNMLISGYIRDHFRAVFGSRRFSVVWGALGGAQGAARGLGGVLGVKLVCASGGAKLT